MAKNKISLLPEHIINQIKAGEVVERPSAILKELLENSVDAGAGTIRVSIREAGMKLLAIEDNGSGISFDDIPFAFARHATSKIQQFEDLYRLDSFGFRGEALASIAAVSKVSCETATSTTHTSFYRVEGGETILHEKTMVNSVIGTKIYIRDLFYNTPVRVKFIKSARSEKNQLIKLLHAFIISNPAIDFSIDWGEGVINKYSCADSSSSRIKQLFMPLAQASLTHCSGSYDGFEVDLFLAPYHPRKGIRKFTYVLINNRIVNDFQIQKIITNSANHLITEGESLSFFAQLRVPASQIDVNIHPSKTTVKIFQAPKLQSLISSLVRETQSKKVVAEPSSEQAELLAPSERVEKLNYKKIDAQNEEELNDFFETLHTQEAKKESIILQLGNVCIINRGGEILLNLEALLRSYFFHVMKSSTNEQVPLLISRPFNVENDISNATKKLANCGFEIDQISHSTLVLRAVPAKLSQLPLDELVKWIIKHDLTTPIQLEFEKLQLSLSEISRIMDELGDRVLFEQRVMRRLTSKDLLALL